MSYHNLCKYFSHLIHHRVRDTQRQATGSTVWSAEAPLHLKSVVSILKMISGVEATELSRQLLQLSAYLSFFGHRKRTWIFACRII